MIQRSVSLFSRRLAQSLTRARAQTSTTANLTQLDLTAHRFAARERMRFTIVSVWIGAIPGLSTFFLLLPGYHWPIVVVCFGVVYQTNDRRRSYVSDNEDDGDLSGRRKFPRSIETLQDPYVTPYVLRGLSPPTGSESQEFTESLNSPSSLILGLLGKSSRIGFRPKAVRRFFRRSAEDEARFQETPLTTICHRVAEQGSERRRL